MKTATQFRGPADHLAYLRRIFDRLQVAAGPTAILDAGIACALASWSMAAWTYPFIERDPALRKRMAWAAELATTTSLDQDVFASLAAEQCPELRICQAIAAEPWRLVAEPVASGWKLYVVEDGERQPVGAAFERVVMFWNDFTKREGLVSQRGQSKAA